MESSVKTYYGKTLQSTCDLKTDACKTSCRPPKYIQSIIDSIHPDVLNRYYGCGLVIPSVLKGCRILDLGCGAGRDCYILSKLVGPTGFVVGIDMTQEQLDVAQKYIEYHEEKFGYDKPNVEFTLGNIENLQVLESNSFDIVISNCVINLCQNKENVLKEVYRVLKPGGELYFSDVYSDRIIPQEIRNNEILWGECLSGALYWNEFLQIARKVGFPDPRLVTDDKITVTDPNLNKIIGHIGFYSATYRLWKLDSLVLDCEDYGQAVIYRGGIDENKTFTLDAHHIFEIGKTYSVCSNTFNMLHKTRLNEYFSFIGDESKHYGIFDGCGKSIPFASAKSNTEQKNCC